MQRQCPQSLSATSPNLIRPVFARQSLHKGPVCPQRGEFSSLYQLFHDRHAPVPNRETILTFSSDNFYPQSLPQPCPLQCSPPPRFYFIFLQSSLLLILAVTVLLPLNYFLLICYQYPRGQSFISGSPCFFKTLQTALLLSTCLEEYSGFFPHTLFPLLQLSWQPPGGTETPSVLFICLSEK